MKQLTEVRIDKWLWAVRLFKTRSQAAEACRKKMVAVGEQTVKAARNVKVGDIIHVKKPPVVFSFKVLNLSEKRMGAKLVPDFMQDVTAEDQIEIFELQKINSRLQRQKGLGRPTKKDRRDLEDFFSPE